MQCSPHLHTGLLLGLALARAAPAAAMEGAPTKRVAVIVGSNEPIPGRPALRHAQRDTVRIADALVAVGGFERRHVRVLADPTPGEMVAVLEHQIAVAAGAPGSLFLFYYSGHADGQRLYPAGKPLPIETVRQVLDRAEVSVRIGIFDACGGGIWTRAKGLAPEAPFSVALPMNLATEGSVLIAASAGIEAAHESDALQGSFFTSHLAAALRGAADRNEDGEVTLAEAFEYAKERTIRDTAKQAPDPQHPSYAVNLRGRKDLVLARVATSTSTMDLTQSRGPLEIVHLDSGLAVLETPAGPRRVKVAVPPGRYIVRKVTETGVYWTSEITVAAGRQNRIGEQDLAPSGTDRLALKGPPAEIEFESSTRAKRDLLLAFGAGMAASPLLGRGLVVQAQILWGVSDRLTWGVSNLGLFAYSFGRRGGVEVVPEGGLSLTIFNLSGKAALGIRAWLGESQSIVGTGSAYLLVEESATSSAPNPEAAQTARAAALGYTISVGRLSLHVGAAINGRTDGTFLWRGYGFGSVLVLGLRQLPLVEIRMTRHWAADLFATSTYAPVEHGWTHQGALGLTAIY